MKKLHRFVLAGVAALLCSQASAVDGIAIQCPFDTTTGVQAAYLMVSPKQDGRALVTVVAMGPQAQLVYGWAIGTASPTGFRGTTPFGKSVSLDFLTTTTGSGWLARFWVQQENGTPFQLDMACTQAW